MCGGGSHLFFSSFCHHDKKRRERKEPGNFVPSDATAPNSPSFPEILKWQKEEMEKMNRQWRPLYLCPHPTTTTIPKMWRRLIWKKWILWHLLGSPAKGEWILSKPARKNRANILTALVCPMVTERKKEWQNILLSSSFCAKKGTMCVPVQRIKRILRVIHSIHSFLNKPFFKNNFPLSVHFPKVRISFVLDKK